MGERETTQTGRMKRLDLHDEIGADLDRIWNWLALEQKAPEAADRVRDAA